MLDKWVVFDEHGSGHGTSGEPATGVPQGASPTRGVAPHETAVVKPAEHCPKCGCPRCGAILHHPEWATKELHGRAVSGACFHCGAFLLFAKDEFRVATLEEEQSAPEAILAAVDAMQGVHGGSKYEVLR